MDIRGAFDYADRNTMVKVMKEMELPKAVLKMDLLVGLLRKAKSGS